MFSVNSYAKIKEVEDKGKYAICKISTSKKNQTNNKYETDFVDKVRFVGKAFNQRPRKDQRIKIISCAVSNCYVKDNSLEFMKKPTYTIFDYELQADSVQNTDSKLDLEPVDENFLPF